jgi:hypothetical protein
MFKKLVVAMLSFVVTTTAFAAGQATPAQTGSPETNQSQKEGVPTQGKLVFLSVPSRLIKPLMVTGAQNSVLVAATYEYCLGMEAGVEINISSEHRKMFIDAAVDLVSLLRRYSCFEEAEFYAACVVRY